MKDPLQGVPILRNPITSVPRHNEKQDLAWHSTPNRKAVIQGFGAHARTIQARHVVLSWLGVSFTGRAVKGLKA